MIQSARNSRTEECGLTFNVGSLVCVLIVKLHVQLYVLIGMLSSYWPICQEIKTEYFCGRRNVFNDTITIILPIVLQNIIVWPFSN